MNKKRAFCKYSALAGFLVLFFSCASSPAPEDVSKSGTVVVIHPDVKQNRTFFSSINKRAVELAENGSPESLKMAVSLVHKSNDEEYTENERVFLGMCSSIMEILWPSENSTWDIPSFPRENQYIGAIDSARRGIFDSSTGNSDFFTITLPSLVVVTAENKSDYIQSARESLQNALSLQSDSVMALYLYGRLLEKKGEYSEALKYLEKAKTFSPSNFEILFALMNCYYNCGEYNSAYIIGESLLSRFPQNVDVLHLSSRCAYGTGNLDKAEEYVVRIILLEPENISFLLFRAKILMEKADYIRASSLLDVYSRSDVNGKDYLLLRAQLQRDWNKNLTAAGEIIGKALRLYPQDMEVQLFAAEIASSSGIAVNGLKAVDIAGLVLKSDSSNYRGMKVYVTEMIKMSSWQEAYTYSSKVIGMSCADDEDFYSHIEICLALKKNDEASLIVNRLYSKNPQDENILQCYIKVLIATGKKDAALEMINRLLPSANAKMKSFLYYERSFYNTNDDDVLNDLRSSLTSNPRNKDSLYRLYEIYYGKKDWNRAQYYLKQVVALDSQNTRLLEKNAELDALRGKTQ